MEIDVPQLFRSSEISSMPTITSLWPTSHSSDVSSSDDWEGTFSFIDAICIGRGGSSIVFVIDNQRVLKVFPQDEEGERDLERELSIYLKIERDGGSDYIVRFYKVWESGLVLERHARTLRQILVTLEEGARSLFALQWVQESCRAVNYLHQKEIWHGDLGCQNIMLDQENHLKLCDFAGSKFRNGDTWEDAWISYEVRSQHPEYRGKQPTIETEIFALGSIIFEIWTSRPPYSSETDPTVRQKFVDKDFPLFMIDDAKIRGIVKRCWMGAYNSVAEICTEVE
jgi:serine/threonine protein kinase